MEIVDAPYVGRCNHLPDKWTVELVNKVLALGPGKALAISDEELIDALGREGQPTRLPYATLRLQVNAECRRLGRWAEKFVVGHSRSGIRIQRRGKRIFLWPIEQRKIYEGPLKCQLSTTPTS